MIMLRQAAPRQLSSEVMLREHFLCRFFFFFKHLNIKRLGLS